MNPYQNILAEKGISPSFQRLRIFAFLMETKSHPTAFSIYNALKQEIPSLSKTTVYNVLKLLSEKGLVNEVRIEDNELRFDAVTKQHGHFKCTTCGEVKDLFIGEELSRLVDKENIITEIQFNITGVCQKCI